MICCSQRSPVQQFILYSLFYLFQGYTGGGRAVLHSYDNYPRWIDEISGLMDVRCQGNETSLLDCDYRTTHRICDSYISVVCYASSEIALEAQGITGITGNHYKRCWCFLTMQWCCGVSRPTVPAVVLLYFITFSI